jgi:hypothetical protein
VNASEPRRSASDELLDGLMAAARREAAAERSGRTLDRRPRRHRGRIAGIVVALGLGAAAAAGAADLISTGDPVRDMDVKSPRLEPADARAPQLVAKAADPEGGVTWGVGIFTSAAGLHCAVAGQVRGLTLGMIRDGRFHPYETGSFGACGSARLPIASDRLTITGSSPRTIVFGRTRDADRVVVVQSGGRTYSTRPARGGGFLFVFDGKLAVGDAIPRLGAKLRP